MSKRTQTADLERMGIGVDVLTIQEISDEEDYLNALGRRRTAEVKRDAIIGEAEAQRDSKVKSSEALQEGEKAKYGADANIATDAGTTPLMVAANHGDAETVQDYATAIAAYEKFLALKPDDPIAPDVRRQVKQLRALSGATG